MKEIILKNRKEKVEFSAKVLLDKINNTHKKNEGLKVHIWQVGTENEIIFSVGEEPIEEGIIGRLTVEFKSNDYQIQVNGLHEQEDSMCAAIVLIGKALRYSVIDILGLFSEHGEEIPEPFRKHGSYLYSILENALFEYWEELLDGKNKEE
jgi:hypothetical protein